MFPQAVYFPIRTLYFTLKFEQRYMTSELAAAMANTQTHPQGPVVSTPSTPGQINTTTTTSKIPGGIPTITLPVGFSTPVGSKILKIASNTITLATSTSSETQAQGNHRSVQHHAGYIHFLGDTDTRHKVTTDHYNITLATSTSSETQAQGNHRSLQHHTWCIHYLRDTGTSYIERVYFPGETSNTASGSTQQQSGQTPNQPSGGETGPIRATPSMWWCSRIMRMQRDIHPTVLSSLEGIVDQVNRQLSHML
uniref:Uncharacterized protein n=1 Tax=Timema shepardi TaxID=629360 RepID=A0A7R9B032_TIMSH|nr:unnamed protein product [Timema shepardi]